MVNYDGVAGMGLARGPRGGTRHVPSTAWLAQPRNVFFLLAGQRRPAMVMKYVIVAGVSGDA